MAIEPISTMNSRMRALGIDVVYYRRDGEEIHIQDLATKIAVARAQTVRNELEPLQRLMRTRNKQSEKLGNLLAHLNKIETLFGIDAQGSERLTTNALSAEDALLLTQLGYPCRAGDYPSKAEVQGFSQAVKSMIDVINNSSQVSMNRAQQLVETSDGSYDTASKLLKALSDSQGNTIGGVGA